jgi:hypothetical protein
MMTQEEFEKLVKAYFWSAWDNRVSTVEAEGRALVAAYAAALAEIAQTKYLLQLANDEVSDLATIEVKLTDEVEYLRKAQAWHSVADELPDTMRKVFVWGQAQGTYTVNGDDRPYGWTDGYAYYYPDQQRWDCYTWNTDDVLVSHWREYLEPPYIELPEPPQSEARNSYG